MMSPWLIQKKRKKNWDIRWHCQELNSYSQQILRDSKHLDYNTNSLVACLNIFIGQIIGGTAKIKQKNNWEYNKMPLPRIEQGTRIIDRHT